MTSVQFFSLAEMPRCDACPPCFIKKRCMFCANCLPNSKGGRKHRKCLRMICLRDRKAVPFPCDVTTEGKVAHAKKLLKVSEAVLAQKNDLKNVQLCENPMHFAKLLLDRLQKAK